MDGIGIVVTAADEVCALRVPISCPSAAPAAETRTNANRWQAGQGPAARRRSLRSERERFRAKACPGLDPGWIPVPV